MVSRSYLLDRTAVPPSSLRRRFDQQVVPAAIDAAAAIEGVIERLSRRTLARPTMMLLGAFGCALLAAHIRRARR